MSEANTLTMEFKKNNKQIKVDGSNLKIAIILPYFNENIGLELLQNAKEELLKNNVKEKNIELIRVAGALEIPFACQKIIQKKKPDAIITLGAIIKGETSHYDMVCENTYRGIMDIQLKSNVPIIFGILTCKNEEQANHRASKDGLNKGKQVAQATLIQTTL